MKSPGRPRPRAPGSPTAAKRPPGPSGVDFSSPLEKRGTGGSLPWLLSAQAPCGYFLVYGQPFANRTAEIISRPVSVALRHPFQKPHHREGATVSRHLKARPKFLRSDRLRRRKKPISAGPEGAGPPLARSLGPGLQAAFLPPGSTAQKMHRPERGNFPRLQYGAG